MLKKFVIGSFLILGLQISTPSSWGGEGTEVIKSGFWGSGVGVLVGIGAGTIVGLAADNGKAGTIVFASCILAGFAAGIGVGIYGQNKSTDTGALIHFDQNRNAQFSVPPVWPLIKAEKISGVSISLLSSSF